MRVNEAKNWNETYNAYQTALPLTNIHCPEKVTITSTFSLSMFQGHRHSKGDTSVDFFFALRPVVLVKI